MSMGCGFTSTYDGFCYNPCFGNFWGLSPGTGKLCIFGHLGLVFIWNCFVSCLLLLLYYVICAPVLTEGTNFCFRNFDLLCGILHHRPFCCFFNF